MKILTERFVAFLLVIFFAFSPVWATCGGGGGGGGGGTSGGGGGGPDPAVYKVPWGSPRLADSPEITAGLILYWFPASKEELAKSSLRESRTLSLYASQCINMFLADVRTPDAKTMIGDSKLPIAVLADHDNTVINKVENKNGKLNVADVEKLVSGEVKKREAALDASLKDAKSKATGGDKDAAIGLYKSVLAEKCMFPKKAKDAEKELKKLGQGNVADVAAAPIFEARQSDLIARTMKLGLNAENNAKYLLAEKYYSQANKLDPADPTPLRYLGELYRHQTGDWEKAKKAFNEILNMPADPLSRAVALHGLGKITIHEGEFKKGLSLMEKSVAEYPLALAYRNLAVYWHSEGELAKGNLYTEKALEIDPKDPYNLVFAAVFMAASGKGDEALKIARANAKLLPASYNLAAIFALTGRKKEALAYLKRHFFEYERFQAVRSKEMMEARVDAVFKSLINDADFLALTSGADGMLPMPMSPRQTAEPIRLNN